MFELSWVNYEEVLEQGDSILVRVIGGSSYRDYTVFTNHYFRSLSWLNAFLIQIRLFAPL